jgi:CHASE2 domain-containing sensor protein
MTRVKQKARRTKKRVQNTHVNRWSFSSLGVIIVVLLITLLSLLVLMRNAAQDQLQQYGISEGSTLEHLSADMDFVDVDVLDAEMQLLPTE